MSFEMDSTLKTKQVLRQFSRRSYVKVSVLSHISDRVLGAIKGGLPVFQNLSLNTNCRKMKARLKSIVPTDLARIKSSSTSKRTGIIIKELLDSALRNPATTKQKLRMLKHDKIVHIHEYLAIKTKNPILTLEFFRTAQQNHSPIVNLDKYLKQVLEIRHTDEIVEMIPWISNITNNGGLDYVCQLAMKESRPRTAQRIFFQVVSRCNIESNTWCEDFEFPSEWLKSHLPTNIVATPKENQEMNGNPVRFNIHNLLRDSNTTKQVISSVYKQKNVSKLLNLLDICFGLRDDCNFAICMQYITMDVKSRFGTDAAVKILTNIPNEHLSNQLRSTIVGELLRMNKIQDAELLCNSTDSQSQSVYASWIRFYTMSTKLDTNKALLWYNKMLKNNIPPTSIITTQILASILSQRLTQKALKLALELFNSVEKYNIHDDVLYMTMLGILLRAEDDRKVETFLQKMKVNNVPLNMRILHMLLLYYVRHQNRVNVHEILQEVELIEVGLHGLLTCSNQRKLLNCSVQVNDVEGVHYILNTMITYHLKSRNVESALYYINLAVAAKIGVSNYMRKSVLKHIGKNGSSKQLGSLVNAISNAQSAQSLFAAQMLHGNERDKIETLLSAMFYYKNKGDIHSSLALASHLLNRLKTAGFIDQGTANPVVSGLLKLAHLFISSSNSNEEVSFWIARIKEELRFFIDKGLSFDTQTLFIFRDIVLETKDYHILLEILNLQQNVVANHEKFDQALYVNFLRSTINILTRTDNQKIIKHIVTILDIKREGPHAHRLLAISSLIRQKVRV